MIHRFTLIGLQRQKCCWYIQEICQPCQYWAAFTIGFTLELNFNFFFSEHIFAALSLSASLSLTHTFTHKHWHTQAKAQTLTCNSVSRSSSHSHAHTQTCHSLFLSRARNVIKAATSENSFRTSPLLWNSFAQWATRMPPTHTSHHMGFQCTCIAQSSTAGSKSRS